jgi:hypothetical protein
LDVTKEIIPFLSASTKVNTKETYVNAINTIFIPPNFMHSLGKARNMLHRMALVAKDKVDEFLKNLPAIDNEFDCDDEDNETSSEVVESGGSNYV